MLTPLDPHADESRSKLGQAISLFVLWGRQRRLRAAQQEMLQQNDKALQLDDRIHGKSLQHEA